MKHLHEPPQSAPAPAAPAEDVVSLVQRMLETAISRGASDVHIEPTAIDYEIRFRIDGILELQTRHEPVIGRSIVSRLMVMSRLLTYRLDIPQEGRMQLALEPRGKTLDLRVAIMPTSHGLRAAVRLPAELTQPKSLDPLDLPPPAPAGLKRFFV